MILSVFCSNQPCNQYRSATMDKWTRGQILKMVAGGNQRAREFFKSKGWTQMGASNANEKYTSRAAKLYRTHLEKEAVKANGKLDSLLSHTPEVKPVESPVALTLDTNSVCIYFKSSFSPALFLLFGALSLVLLPRFCCQTLSQFTCGQFLIFFYFFFGFHDVSTISQNLDSLINQIKSSPNGSTPASSPPPTRSVSAPPKEAVPEPKKAPAVEEKPVRRVVVRKKKDTPKRVVIHKEHHEAPNLHAVKLTKKASSKPRPSNSLLSTRKGSSNSGISSAKPVQVSGSDDFDSLFNQLSVEDKLRREKAKEDEANEEVNRAVEQAKMEEEKKKADEEKAARERAARIESGASSSTAVGNGAPKRFQNAKSISSDQYFNEGAFAPPTDDQRRKLEQFSGARSIGSDQFFNDGQPQQEEEPDVGAFIQEKSEQFKNIASDFFNSMRDRYS